ncbi:sodium:alanine symporter family protein [uncultured Pseudoteredinibacter sp.]|uniref:alanine/glycine:cation symporter family protein n=1 Tax=uncultured Pseudoteredinibacter sp. TaxID=1641701 RepID=UPI0026037124|nr:sodium:alanine symporter family protein [uncultured Pseudoteredinibacter sp.]
MEILNNIVSTINGVVWGPYMLALLLGTGIFLTLGLNVMPIRKIPTGFRLLWGGRRSDRSDAGELSPFNALMTSLSATVGTGNIAGVATAVVLGGPGALFWMWITALVGMATKYSEAVLAVKYREVDEEGNHSGGPMYYIRNGLGEKWTWLAGAFAFFGAFAAFGIGNTVQSNSVADGLNSAFGIPNWISGLVLFVLVGAVVLGGVKRVGEVAGKLVPLMGIGYFLCGLVVLFVNAAEIPAAFALIVDSAFNGHAATGGFAGAAMVAAIRFGVARGVFSNEAGLGSAAIAHAHAKTKDPVKQGMVAMLGTFIDTIIVCTVTGLAIVSTGVWQTGVKGAPLTAAAFEASLPGVGEYMVAISLAIFAFTTILGWSVYGERCVEFLFGKGAIKPFRFVWVLVVPVGTVVGLDFVWLLADTFNALMALPNLIALLLLSPVVFKLTREYFNKKENNDSAANEA